MSLFRAFQECGWRVRYGLFLLFVVALLITGVNCGPVLTPKESFMLAYIDNSSVERIRVRNSPDGLSWALGDPTGTTADAGIGAAASEDVVGVMRILVHNKNIGKFYFRWGLGGQTWDATDVDPVTPPPVPNLRGVAQIAHASSAGWLVTNLGGSGGFVPTVLLYSNSNPHTLTDVSPSAAMLNLGSLNVLEAPAIATHAGLVVLSYLRHNGIGDAATLVDLQVLTGTVGSGGAVTWTPAATFTLPETGYGPPVSRPALAYDNNTFLLGVLRQATAGSTLRLFIYASSDGISWVRVKTLDNVPAVAPKTLRIALAAKKNGTTVVVFTAPGVAKMHRWNGGTWSEVPGNLVFGSDTPNWYQTALIRAGQAP